MPPVAVMKAHGETATAGAGMTRVAGTAREPGREPVVAAQARADHRGDDRLGTILARAVETRVVTGAARRRVIQRSGITDEEAELVGEAVGTVVLRIWNWLAGYFGAERTTTTADDNGVQAQDDTGTDVDATLAELDERTTAETGSGEIQLPPPVQQALVLVGQSGARYDHDEILEALAARAIRLNFEVNEELLRSYSRQIAHQNVTAYSPDVEQALSVVVETVRQRRAAELETVERLRALQREAARLVKATQEIHESLRGSLKASQSTDVMQQLAGRLARFVVENRLGGELTEIATSISERVHLLKLKDFKVSPAMLEKITAAPALFDALLYLSDVVDERLSVQAKSSTQGKGPPKLNKYQLEAAERRKRQLAKRIEDDPLDVRVTEVREEPVVVARVLPPFVRLGQLYGKTIYGRIDWHLVDERGGQQMAKLKQTVTTRGHDLRAIYDAAMRAAVAPANTTGIDCTKPEGAKQWVVKVSYPTAKALGLDDTKLNIASPLALEDDRGDGKYLTFDQMVFRH